MFNLQSNALLAQTLKRPQDKTINQTPLGFSQNDTHFTHRMAVELQLAVKNLNFHLPIMFQ